MEWKYYVLPPGYPYGIQLFDVKSLKEARLLARVFLNCKRLPKGTQVWRSKK